MSGGQKTLKLAKADTPSYSTVIRLYVDLTWDSISFVQTANSSGTSYSNAASSASGTSTIAAFSSTNGKYVSDISQSSAVDGTPSSALRLYFLQTGSPNAYYHPTISAEDWDTASNYLTLVSANPGDVVKISSITWSHEYTNLTQKWFTYSATKIGQLLHFNVNGGVLPSGQSETIEADGTTYGLPAGCTRSANDGYVFDKWTYGGVSYDASASITLASGTNDVGATYKVTAASFAAYLLDSARDSESCATKYIAAKALADQMSETEKTAFESAAYSDAYQRWQAWKAANRDATTTPSAIVASSDRSSAFVLGGIAVLAVLAAGGYFFVRKKKSA